MKAPIADFIENYKNSGKVRLHMPGHKGKSKGFEDDITEIPGADELFHANGIIRESEEYASELFGTGKTLYSTEGSSLSIRAMLHLAAVYAKSLGKEPYILADRGSHKVFSSAVALLDISVKWINSSADDGGIYNKITPCDVDYELRNCEKMPTAVYITSPNYLGFMVDVEKIAKVCKRHGVLLLVDNAHGAYTAFLGVSRHPIHLGADMCTDSAHKTLPTLTGGAYLHISKDAPKMIMDSAKSSMELFASTSPSYLILKSLDLTNRYIDDGYRQKLASAIEGISSLKRELSAMGYELIGDEPLKITLSAKPYGYLGTEIAELLSCDNITVEFSDPDYVVMMLTPEVLDDARKSIINSLKKLPRRTSITTHPPKISRPIYAMTPREALLSPSELISVHDSVGRVSASPSVSCPPAIPIVTPGEIISKEALDMFSYYGISECRVVMEK